MFHGRRCRRTPLGSLPDSPEHLQSRNYYRCSEGEARVWKCEDGVGESYDILRLLWILVVLWMMLMAVWQTTLCLDTWE